MGEYDRLVKAVEAIRKITNFCPKVGVILGSGLGAFADDIRVIGKIPYKRIPGFPVSTISGHEGQFVFGYVEKIPVVLMQGRVHYYEGYSMQDVVMPARIMGMLGASVVILTNAAGGINKNFYEGALMSISDHIASFVPSPLIGENIDELGERFPDMTNVYDEDLRKLVESTARALQIPIREGVYLQTTGPNYETPSEIKMYSLLGADAVGMSTACEAIALRHMGIRVCGISCITNMASGLSKKHLSHDEVKQTADSISEKFRSLIWHTIIAVNELFRIEKEEKAAKKIPAKEDKVKKEQNFSDELNFDDLEIIQIK
ncbi:MAG: purine-nucleoside phosphorylase [Lachnospiraceae bacterium]